MGHAVENHVLKTVDSDLNRDLLSFRHSEMFWRTQENIKNTQLRLLFQDFPFSRQNISECLKRNRPRFAIHYLLL